MVVTGLSSSPVIRPVKRVPVGQAQPITRTADGSAEGTATRVGREQGTQAPVAVQRGDPRARAEDTTAAPTSDRSGSGSPTGQFADLTLAQRRQLTELRARDREVRAHEAAHQAAAGRFAGPVQFDFQRGPDGQRYAVGGEVQIDTSPVPGDPEATIDKMKTVRAAALAPANPSPQDQAVAAQASQEIVQARAELLAQRSAASRPGGSSAVDSTEGGVERPVDVASTPREPASIEAPMGRARDAALAFSATERFGRLPASLAVDAGRNVNLFA